MIPAESACSKVGLRRVSALWGSCLGQGPWRGAGDSLERVDLDWKGSPFTRGWLSWLQIRKVSFFYQVLAREVAGRLGVGRSGSPSHTPNSVLALPPPPPPQRDQLVSVWKALPMADPLRSGWGGFPCLCQPSWGRAWKAQEEEGRLVCPPCPLASFVHSLPLPCSLDLFPLFPPFPIRHPARGPRSSPDEVQPPQIGCLPFLPYKLPPSTSSPHHHHLLPALLQPHSPLLVTQAAH